MPEYKTSAVAVWQEIRFSGFQTAQGHSGQFAVGCTSGRFGLPVWTPLPCKVRRPVGLPLGHFGWNWRAVKTEILIFWADVGEVKNVGANI